MFLGDVRIDASWQDTPEGQVHEVRAATRMTGRIVAWVSCCVPIDSPGNMREALQATSIQRIEQEARQLCMLLVGEFPE
jgi:hypothetical protein